MQVGSYSRAANALAIVDGLRKQDIPAFAFKITLDDGRTWYRVLVGRYATLAAARNSAQSLQQAKHAGAFAVTTRYALSLREPAQSPTLQAETRKQLANQGFYPYQGTDAGWLVGAYARKSEAQAVARELAMAGIEVQVVGW